MAEDEIIAGRERKDEFNTESPRGHREVTKTDSRVKNARIYEWRD